MRKVLLKQAILNLKSFKMQSWRVRLALKQVEKLETIEKDEGLSDFVKSPSFHNIINLLGPLSSYYKINQVLNLLKEMGNEFNKPQAPLYGIPQYMKEKWH